MRNSLLITKGTHVETTRMLLHIMTAKNVLYKDGAALFTTNQDAYDKP